METGYSGISIIQFDPIYRKQAGVKDVSAMCYLEMGFAILTERRCDSRMET